MHTNTLDDEWNKKRERIEEDLIAAALKLQRHTDSFSFEIPMRDESLRVSFHSSNKGLAENVEELERKISGDVLKLQALTQKTYINIDVQPKSKNDPHLFVTVGPDSGPPDAKQKVDEIKAG